MTDHFPRPSARATSRQDRVAELHQLAAADYASTANLRRQNPTWPVSSNAALPALPDHDEPSAPSDLDVAISVAQQLLDSDSVLSMREALRLLLRALGAEPVDQAPAPRCPAAHPEDPTPCVGPVAVMVLDAANAGARGCEHHAARLLASLKGGRVYALPDAPDGAAIRVFKAADGTRPFAWHEDAPRIEPSQFSHAENRHRGEDR